MIQESMWWLVIMVEFASPPQRSMPKVWSWRPSNSTGWRPVLTSSLGTERRTTSLSLKEAGNAMHPKQRQNWIAVIAVKCSWRTLLFFISILLKMFLLCGEPSHGETGAVNRNQLWPHRHHRTWVPTRSGFLARAVEIWPGWLRQNHVGPHLGG